MKGEQTMAQAICTAEECQYHDGGDCSLETVTLASGGCCESYEEEEP
jgi:hypothetical protein